MKQSIFIFSIVTILFFGCSPKKVVTQAPKTKTFSNSYEISSPYGHKFRIEVDYIAKDLNTLNNGCEAQYIITNIGDKDFIREERFPIGDVIINGSKLQNFVFDPSLIFEFTTSDGKKIESSETLFHKILIGKSSSANSVSIDAGLRVCTGEVKPIRIDYRKEINQ